MKVGTLCGGDDDGCGDFDADVELMLMLNVDAEC